MGGGGGCDFKRFDYSIASPVFVTQDFGSARAGARGRFPGTCGIPARLLREPSPASASARAPHCRDPPAARPPRAHAARRTFRSAAGPRVGREGRGPRYLGDARRCRYRAPWRPQPDPDAAASFSARRRAPDFRFRLPRGHAHARSNLESLGGGFPLASRCAPIGLRLLTGDHQRPMSIQGPSFTQ